MATASGPFKQLAYKKETTWGVLAGAAGATLLRRKTSTLDETRDTFSSDEIRTDQQRGTYVHGPRKLTGSITGDLSGGTYCPLIGSHLRRDFTALTAISTLSLTIAAGSLLGSIQSYTITRASGSWLADGMKCGMFVRITAGAVNAANSNKNLFVVAATATVLTVTPWGNGQMVAEGPIASCTVSMPGKLTYIPSTGHTNDSYTFEHRFTDLAQYEVFTGARIASLNFNLPPSGILEFSADVLGRGFGQAPGSTPYFTSPSPATTSQGITAVNGFLRTGSGLLAAVTGLSIKSDGGMTTGQVVGSNYSPDVFVAPIVVNGQLTAYFDSATLRDAFYLESQIALSVVAYAGTTAAAEGFALTLPAIKLGNAGKSDGPGPIILTCPFEAIYNATGGAGTDSEATTLWVQDSLAP